MERSVNTTLIIRLSSIGDVLLASPLIRLLRKRWPAARIDFLVKREYADLVRFNPHLSSVIEFDARNGRRELRLRRQELRRVTYDLIVDIQGNFRSFLLRTMNARKIVHVNKRRLARFLLVNLKWDVYRVAPPVPIRYMEPLGKIGLVDDGEGLEVFVPESIVQGVQRRLSETGVLGEKTVVGFCPGAKHATKRWPLERFSELAVRLIDEGGLTIMLFGGEEDRARCAMIEHRVIQKTGEPARVVNLAGTLSLLETAAAMDCCDVIVTNDTGLLHLAAARKKKVLAIYGPTVKEFGFFPYGTESRVFERVGLYCRPCSHIGKEVCPEGHFLCMKETGVEEVLRGVKSFLPVPV
jgi:lipopolysaccharide heptosyltransferase II